MQDYVKKQIIKKATSSLFLLQKHTIESYRFFKFEMRSNIGGKA